MAELELDMAPIVDRLYTLPPDEFAAARDAAVRQARTEGKAPLAREVARLRKPTQSAWLINLLWRDQRDVMNQLFELASELMQAQVDAAGSVLRALTTQRREIETALMRRAVELAQAAGVKVSDAQVREAQETLGAALAQPEVAEEVRSGRLVKPATYVGFGMLPTAAPPRAEPTAPVEPIDLQAAAARRASETEARRERERRVEAARGTLAAAAEEVKTAEAAAEDADKRSDDLRQQLETLRAQVRRLEVEVGRAAEQAEAASSAREAARRAHAEAAEALQRAERELTG